MRLLLLFLFASTFGVEITLDSPATITGNCNPSRVHFTGHIIASAPGKITYVWLRSDKGASSAQTLEFTRPGPLPVGYDWLLRRTTNGWVALKVLTPTPLESGKAGFELICR
jgi:hypothetical protein